MFLFAVARNLYSLQRPTNLCMWRLYIASPSPSLHVMFSVPQEVLSTTETALAMNRYIGSALLPLLTRCAALFANTEHYAQLIDSTLQTIYRLSKGRSLTKAQRDAIEDCLLAICK